MKMKTGLKKKIYHGDIEYLKYDTMPVVIVSEEKVAEIIKWQKANTDEVYYIPLINECTLKIEGVIEAGFMKEVNSDDYWLYKDGSLLGICELRLAEGNDREADRLDFYPIEDDLDEEYMIEKTKQLQALLAYFETHKSELTYTVEEFRVTKKIEKQIKEYNEGRTEEDKVSVNKLIYSI